LDSPFDRNIHNIKSLYSGIGTSRSPEGPAAEAVDNSPEEGGALEQMDSEEVMQTDETEDADEGGHDEVIIGAALRRTARRTKPPEKWMHDPKSMRALLAPEP
jgi:hypothetical protein